MFQRLLTVLKRWRHFRDDADIEEELRVHLDMQAEEYAGPTVSGVEAQRRAAARLGRTRSTLEQVRDQELATHLESWYGDFVLGIRALRKNPVFCVTAILTLALGIGANTAIFTLLYGLLLRSLPVHQPDRLVRIGLVIPEREGNVDALPYRMVDELNRRQTFMTVFSAWDSGDVPVRDREGALRRYNANFVSGNGFQMLGMKPYAGRLLMPSDDVRGGSPDGWAVVLSHSFWMSRFGGDPRAIGQRLEILHTSVTIVGVAPPDFQGMWPGIDAKLYLPFQFVNVVMQRDVLNSENVWFCGGIGRLRPGASIASANAELATYEQQVFDRTIPASQRYLPFLTHIQLRVAPARSGIPSYVERLYSKSLFILQGLVTLVLLLCCVNVGGLMMSKLYARQHEFAIRVAVGGARWRLARQYLTESFVIAFAGAALGAVAAWFGSEFMLRFFRDPNQFDSMSVHPDGTVFWVTGLFAIGSTLFFGSVPAWKAGHADPGALFKSRSAIGGNKHIAGRAFVPVQIGLSLVLVTLATLLSQSLIRLRTERTGFDLSHVTIQTPPFHTLPQHGAAKLDVYQRMVDRMEELPGMRAAAVTYYTPMSGEQPTAQFQPVGHAGRATDSRTFAYNYVGPGYFQAMGTEVLAGRGFDRRERTEEVCVLNQSAAKFLFPAQEALGRYVRNTNSKEFPHTISCRVVGIAEDAKFASLREAPPRTIYFPITVAIANGGNLVFLMNAATKASAIADYRKALSEIAPNIPLVLFATLEDQMDAALGSERLITIMSTFFGGLALFLSAIGLYGLLSSSVAQRTREIGLRIALGARPWTVLRMILSEAFTLVALGTVLGAISLFFAVRAIQNLLYGVSSSDPLTFLATGILLTIVSLIAAFLPALRAASIDPMDAMRLE